MDWTLAWPSGYPGRRGDRAGALGGGCELTRIGGSHMAALVRHGQEDAKEVDFINVEGTRAMVRIAARYRCRMVFVSTSGTVACFRTPNQTADEGAPYCAREVERWPY